MEKRLSVISIIIEKPEAVERVNALLHENREFIIGRMGIPDRERNVAIISVVIDGPMDQTSALSGKLGMVDGAVAKTLTQKA